MSGDKSKCFIFFSGFIIGFVCGTTYYKSIATPSNATPSNASPLKIFYDPTPRTCL